MAAKPSDMPRHVINPAESGTNLAFTVEWWAPLRGYGAARASDGSTALVRHTDLPGVGYRWLAKGETFKADVVVDGDNQRVRNISDLPIGTNGTISAYDPDRGLGTVVSESGDEYSLHYSELLTARSERVYPSVGESCSFQPGDRNGRSVATRVKVRDPRVGIARWCRIPDYAWQALAGLAETENWELSHNDPDATTDGTDASQDPAFSVLKSYISQTFQRLEAQDRLANGVMQNGIAILGFNTGLVTPNQEEIYGLMQANRSASDIHAYAWLDWAKESDPRIAGVFSPRPQRATYWDDPSVLYFEPGSEIIVDWNHFVVDHIERYPVNLRDPQMARMLTQAAVVAAKNRVQRNYKTAVPQFYRGEVQLLLPLCLLGTAEAQLALVIRKVGSEYHGETVLPLAAAMKNARLLARPDKDWLLA